jgi:hypothetical protein
MLLASFFLSPVLRIRDFEKRIHGCGSATLTRTRSNTTPLSEAQNRIIYVRLYLMFLTRGLKICAWGLQEGKD